LVSSEPIRLEVISATSHTEPWRAKNRLLACTGLIPNSPPSLSDRC
jgi:hypothetical protein